MEPWVAGKGRTEGKKSVKGGRDPDILPVIVLILYIDTMPLLLHKMPCIYHALF